MTEEMIEIGIASDSGRVRSNNEDACGTFEAEWQDDAQTVRFHVAVVADGIGGSNAGETASRIAIEKVRQIMQRQRHLPIAERLDQAALAANQAVYNASLNSPATRGMGTTLAAAAVTDNSLYVIHAGDSRVYLVRGGVARRLTLDHTWAQEAIDAGILTPEEARKHPNRNVVKRYLGTEDQLIVDHRIIDITQATQDSDFLGEWPTVDSLPQRPGDTVLLCSDGLTDMLTDAEIQEIVRKHPPQRAAEQLVAQANVKGGKDNITAVLLRLPGGAPLPVAAAASPRRLPMVAIFGGIVVLASIAALLVWPVVAGPGPEAPTEEMTPENSLIGTTTVIALRPTESPTIVTPAASPTGTDVKAVAEETITVAPTATPLATNTATPTPTRSPTVRPSPVRTTPTVTASSVSIPPGSVVKVELLEPQDGDSGSSTVPFRWKVISGELAPTQAYELIFWIPGEDPLKDGRGAVGTTRNTESVVDIAAKLNEGWQPVEYNWGIRVVYPPPSYQPVAMASSSERRFRFEQATNCEGACR